MLILSRRTGEAIFATHPDGTVIEIMVASVQGNCVRIGITAPLNVLIDREEVHERRERERLGLAADGNVT